MAIPYKYKLSYSLSTVPYEETQYQLNFKLANFNIEKNIGNKKVIKFPYICNIYSFSYGSNFWKNINKYNINHVSMLFDYSFKMAAVQITIEICFKIYY